MASKKAKSARTGGKKKSGSVLSKLGGAAISSLGGGASKGGGGGKRRSKGPNYWANKVIVEKLKKKYRVLKYGSVR